MTSLVVVGARRSIKTDGGERRPEIKWTTTKMIPIILNSFQVNLPGSQAEIRDGFGPNPFVQSAAICSLFD